MERKLSLPISILSPGKPSLTKGPTSHPLLVTKSSIARRFWADPHRIHHDPHRIHHGGDGIFHNPHRIHYDVHGAHHNLGGIHRNHHHEPQEKYRGHQDAAMMASEIVAELKRSGDHFDEGQQKTKAEVSKVLWSSSFNSGGRRIWQEPDSEENYISQEVDP